MFRLRLIPPILAALLLSCSLSTPVEEQSATAQAPSGNHTACVNCHVSEHAQPGRPALLAGFGPSDTCLYCHDYAINHHPVNFAPARAVNPQLPLYDGEIKCLTCHEMHGGEGLSGTPKLLRGGPYADRRESCFGCHDQEAYEAINPHRMLDGEGNIRDIDGKPVCLQCHSVKPNPVVDRTNDVRFRADVAFLCWRCHPPMPGVFFDQHFLVKPEPEMRAVMREAENRHQVIFPLVPRDRITCSTCHNPHQEGIMVHPGAAAGADEKSRLRLKDNCSACHF